jgi:hypothetical protein
MPTLLSEPAAALFAGALWWRRLIDLAVAETGIVCDDWLDCGQASGQAMAALRVGCKRLVVSPRAPGLIRLTDLAALHGACLLASRSAVQPRPRPGLPFP